MSTPVSAIAEKFSQLIQIHRGDPKTPVEGVANPRVASANQIVFIPDPKHLAQAKEGGSQIWLVQPQLLPLVPEDRRVVLSCANVSLAMALIGRAFFGPSLNRVRYGEKAVHPTAVIDPSAEIGANCLIGPHTTIGPGVKIGPDCIIGPNTTIEAETAIGARTHIHPQVYVAYRTVIGADCEIHPQTSIGTEGFGYAHDQTGRHYRITHYGRVRIEDRVHIGAGVQIDRGTFEDSVFGEGTIIDNHSHFGHNFKCGKNCIFVGGVIVAGSVSVGSNCVFGGRTTVAGHITIADGCQFAGLTGIPASIDKPGKYGGYPPIPLNDSLKAQSTIRHLPRMRRQLARVLKHLGLTEGEA
jgi:UDP-3-O-[3-hydroxymyristoyl] glucosamine N-acyltransferase